MTNKIQIIDEILFLGDKNLDLSWNKDLSLVREDFHKLKNKIFWKYKIAKPYQSIELIERYNELNATWELEESLVFKKY